MPEEVVKPGKFVSLTYSMVDDEGNVVEQSDLPVSYIFGGETEMLGGMDQAMQGKKAGDSVEFEVNPEQGFGDHDPDLAFTDDIENVPPQYRHLGAEVQMQNEAGEVKTFYVSKIEGGQLTVDGNHPLAGKHLKVRVKILEVRDATKDDQLHLTPASPPPMH
jgi:FKBP-type peptidyl-prolyl cis-trans isomerase SlyD